MRSVGALSRAKGQRGEREVAAFLRARGIAAQRGFQSRGGGAEEADVVCELPRHHLEVKRSERLNIWAAFQQADDDCHPSDDHTVPAVVFRRNRSPWMVCLRFSDYLDLLGYGEVGE
jgi:hypothetical protein